MNKTPLLFINVIIIATCGLIYELLAGTLINERFLPALRNSQPSQLDVVYKRITPIPSA